ncbi:hypothetical protein CCACVL1_04539 [Corchorus capsularis]|uniref:Uncharacterized protein n=1 Tax=Corchorus capsularis TaxID=210143 RepID=A0A1R3JRK2_COCAP|nr:hypothetical protein CCACVL1_04539 [Corchorus capsularis]
MVTTFTYMWPLYQDRGHSFRIDPNNFATAEVKTPKE